MGGGGPFATGSENFYPKAAPAPARHAQTVQFYTSHIGFRCLAQGLMHQNMLW